MTRNYPDLGRASDWMKQISNQSEALCGKTISCNMKGWLCLSMNPNHFHWKQKENRTKITSRLFNTRLLTAYPQQGWP